MHSPSPERIAEQHSYVDPKYIDYISIRVADKRERTYKPVGILTDAGQKLYITGSDEIDLRNSDFQSSKEARQFCRDYYRGITIQTN